jgi:hypothetical protein
MRHIDRAHLSMMRHLSAQARRKGANSVAEQIGRTGRAPVQRDTALARAQQSFHREQQAAARSMAHPHHTHVKSSIQRGLEAIGLGGAAHPIRRLHHPGGQEVFPFVGRGAAGNALGRAVTMSKRERDAARAHGVPESKLDQWDAHARAHPFRAIAENMAIRSDNKATGAEELWGGYVNAGLAAAAATAVYDVTHPDKPPKGGWPKDPTDQPLPSKPYSQAGQDAKNNRLMYGFETDILRLHADGTITKAQAARSIRWARDQASSANGTLEVRRSRQWIHDHYKPPTAGWAPHVGG